MDLLRVQVNGVAGCVWIVTNRKSSKRKKNKKPTMDKWWINVKLTNQTSVRSRETFNYVGNRHNLQAYNWVTITRKQFSSIADGCVWESFNVARWLTREKRKTKRKKLKLMKIPFLSLRWPRRSKLFLDLLLLLHLLRHHSHLAASKTKREIIITWKLKEISFNACAIEHRSV